VITLSVVVVVIVDVEGVVDAEATASSSTVVMERTVDMGLVRITVREDPGDNLNVTMALEEGTRVLSEEEQARAIGELMLML